MEQKFLGKFPLHTLEQIVYFGYKGASPALMGECAKRNIGLCFYRPNGRFLARTVGTTQGNVLLRKEQYRCSDNEIRSCQIAILLLEKYSIPAVYWKEPNGIIL